jgi:hypothetical protein
MTDYKALCARMADELDHYRQLLMDDRRETHALATEARAARRPKPPNLKERAFAALQNSHVDPVDGTLQLSADAELIIRRALENLND